MCSAARPFCVYREALGERVGEVPKASIPAIISSRRRGAGGRIWQAAAQYGRGWEWLPLVRAKTIEMMLELIRAISPNSAPSRCVLSERSLTEGEVTRSTKQSRIAR